MDQNVLIAIFDKLIKDEINKIEFTQGPRGIRGRDGLDFNFDDHQENIKKIINDYIDSIQHNFKLKFKDLTQDEIAHLKLVFSDLSEEEKFSLKGDKGERGPRGYDGHNFNFEENENLISEMIINYIDSIKSNLKLKFSDLSDEEKSQLIGPKGTRGQKGASFNWDSHKDDISGMIDSKIDSMEEDLKLKFSDLSDEEKDRLKLKFQDLTHEDKESIRGARGSRGRPGRPGVDGINGKDGIDGISAYQEWLNLGHKGTVDDFINSLRVIGPRGMSGIQGRQGIQGRDGRDGKDAPIIVDINVIQRDKRFYFVFTFSDGREIETDYIDIPSIKKTVKTIAAMVFGTGQLDCRGTKIYYLDDLIIAQEFFKTKDNLPVDRVARFDYTYLNDLIIISELKYYDTNGTKVLKKVIDTHTYSNDLVTEILRDVENF